MTHDEYKSRRDDFCKIRDDSFDQFDKIILSLSTGALALSITFIEKVGRPFNLLSFLFIMACWISWGVAIVSNLLSFYFAKLNMDKKIADLDKKYSDFCNTGVEVVEKSFKEKIYTERCNTLALFTFLCGVVFFVAYAGIVQWHFSTSVQPSQNTKIVSKGGNKMTANQQKVNPLSESRGRTESSQPVLKTVTPGKTELSPPIIQSTTTTGNKKD